MADDNTQKSKGLTWGRLLASQILADMQYLERQPDFLKTKNPALRADGLLAMQRALQMTDVFAHVLHKPHYAITGKAQQRTPSTRRPCFDIEIVSDYETELHADFESTQLSLIFRRDAQTECTWQLDEADIRVISYTSPGTTVAEKISLNCAQDEPEHAAILQKFIEDFGMAARGITGINADLTARRHAEHYALLAAKSAIVKYHDAESQIMARRRKAGNDDSYGGGNPPTPA